MIELKAFGNLALNNGQQIPQSADTWSIPAFLFDSRLRTVMQALLALGTVVLLAVIVISQRWWLFCVLPVVILPIGVIIGWLYYRYNLTWAQPAQLLASDEYLHRGGSIEMLLKQQVLRDVDYERIKVQIVMREWVRYPCGTSSCIEMFDHIIREHEEIGPLSVAKQASLERRVRFELPEYLMHGFHTPDNRISWFIRVVIDIRGLPVTEQFYRIDLEPGESRPMKNLESTIRIRIKGDESTMRFPPGDQISGLVEIFPEENIRCQGVEISVLWYTEGKGRRNEGIVQSWRFDVKQLGPGQSFNEAFSCTLPSAPWSYAGHFINIVWSVHVKIDIPLAPDLNRESRFLLLPADLPV